VNDEEIDRLLEKIYDLKVLYVEDNQGVRIQTIKMLSNFFINIQSAKNGTEGLALYNENKFDIVITDVNMPIMNGIEMSKAIRLQDKNIPIIAMSAHNEKEILQDIEKQNIQAYIFKPIDLDKFIEVLDDIFIDRIT